MPDSDRRSILRRCPKPARTSVNSVIGSVLGFLLGGLDGSLYTLLGFILIDYLTGVVAAIARRQMSSEKAKGSTRSWSKERQRNNR